MSLLDIIQLALAALIGALLLARIGRRPPPPPEADPGPPPDRILSLCARLTGDPVRDRAVMDQLLVFGPRAVEPLLDGLAELLRDPDQQTPVRLARLEDLIADLGLMVVGPIAQRLTRLQPTAPLTNSMVRVLHRLGQPGAQQWIQLALVTPALRPLSPRFCLRRGDYRDPVAAASGAFAPLMPGLDRTHLDAVVALVIAHPALIDELWAASHAGERAMILEWLADWLPLARGAHVAAGLADRAAPVRCAAARLAGLMIEPALVPALTELAGDENPRCRRRAVRALANQPGDAGVEALVRAAGDPARRVCIAALEGLAVGPRRALERAAGVAAVGVLAGDPLLGVLHAVTVDAPDPAPVWRALDARPDAADRPLLLALLARFLPDPRVREYLIRQASDGAPAVRIAVVQVLARRGEPEAADLLPLAAIRAGEARVRLQEAAQFLGAAAIMPLARRIATNPAEADDLLPILRVQPYAHAVPSLLRAIEDGGFAVGATIAAGGPEVAQIVDESLRLASLGLLAPALRHLSSWAEPADLPLLIELYDAHPPLRGVVLNLIEMQCGDAVAPLAARIEAGGEDGPLHGLESRHDLLAAMGDGAWTRAR